MTYELKPIERVESRRIDRAAAPKGRRVRIARVSVMRSVVALRRLALRLVALGVVSLDMCAGALVGARLAAGGQAGD